MRPFAYTRATDVDGAIAAVAGDPEAMFVAGGTEVVNWLREGQASPGHLVDVTGLPLAEVEVLDDAVRIGALAPGLAAHPVVRERLPLVAQALASGGTPQVGNMATPAGNLLQRTRCPYFRDAGFPCNRRDPGTGCPAIAGDNRTLAIFGGSPNCIATHPSDLAVALVALDATVVTRGPNGERRIPVEELHPLPGDAPERQDVLEHGELVTAIEVPTVPPLTNAHYLKVRDRAWLVFALVSAAAALELEGNTVRTARIALGGVAPRPWRARAAEVALAGRPLDAAALDTAAEAAVAGAEPQSQNGFKVELTRRAVRRALQVAGGIA